MARLNQIPFQQRVGAQRGALTTVQINMGPLCNQVCRHCHVDAGPHRLKNNMERPVVQRLIALIAADPSVTTVDITGGAPELNPHFRELVGELRAMGRKVIDRCNLTVLFEPGQEDTAEFLAEHDVAIVASLPCYKPTNVDKQRGEGVYNLSIKGLQRLCALGYGESRELDLVYNPLGASLPPPQEALEREYKEWLGETFGIRFHRLFCLTNMPIKRFRVDLRRQGREKDYMALLASGYNEAAAEAIMCRSLVSVSPDGSLYDCDFNQALKMGQGARSIWSIERWADVTAHPIAFGDHCYGCTAGSGSSCTGEIAQRIAPHKEPGDGVQPQQCR